MSSGPARAPVVRELLEKIKSKRVIVYGDLVCDSYLHTTIDRVSREAPVLIVRHREREFRAGGAGNAARNVASLGGRAVPVGFLGADVEGRALSALLLSDKAPRQGLLTLDNAPTPVKTRVLASAPHGVEQQVLRIDRAEPWPALPGLEEELVGLLREILGNADAILISDYGLGTVVPEVGRWVLAEARKKGVPTIVDSRHRLPELRGAKLAAPNEPEMEELAARRLAGSPGALAEAGAELMERMDLEALVVTQGSAGMTVFEKGEEPARVPVFGTDEVADVTGAGDTVAASLALALAAGARPLDAAYLATVAAGLAVMKQGTSTVSAGEILRALDG